MKIDTSSIEGFDEMTPEDKIKALTEYEMPEDRSEEIKKQKDLIDKYTSEISALKKDAKKGLDENERARLEAEERIAAIESENASLKRSMSIATLKASYLSMGYDEKLAGEKAEAMADGDTEKILSCEAKYKESIEKAIRADLIKSTPKPDDKGGADVMTKEKFQKLSSQERFDFSKNHPEEYSRLYGGK